MNTALNRTLLFLALVLSAALLPHSVFASTVYLETNHSDFFVGDAVLIRVRIDTESKDINAIEGDIVLEYPTHAVSLTDINIAGSAFSLWPRKPLPSEDSTAISFVGGVPGGLVSADAIVFNVVLKLQRAGRITLSPDNIGVYLNDGKGTKDEVSVRNLVINVVPQESGTQPADDWGAVIADDDDAPEPFEIALGNDPSVYDNQYFISFFTTDAGSGVAYYEVREGKGAFVRSESPYVLHDQSLTTVIRVKAVDKAGNERTEEFIPPMATVPWYRNISFWIVAAFIVILYVLRRVLNRTIKKFK